MHHQSLAQYAESKFGLFALGFPFQCYVAADMLQHTLTCLLLTTRLAARALSGHWSDAVSSSEGFFGFQGSRPTSPDSIARPTSPDGLGGGMYTSYGMSQGLEGLICASPSAVRRHRSALPSCSALQCATCPVNCIAAAFQPGVADATTAAAHAAAILS